MRHLLLVSCSMLFAYCQLAAQLTSPQAQPARTDLRCFATLDAVVISRSTPVHLHVEVENRSATRKTISGMTVYLEKQLQPKSDFTGPAEYYALVDVVSGSALLPQPTAARGMMNLRRELPLEASKETTFSLDIKKLRWGRPIDSFYPPLSGLFATVPDGKYLLHVEVDSADGGTALSRSTEVTIARNGQVTHPKP